MRLIFYILLFSQILNFLDVLAQKNKENSSQLSSVKWERVEEKSKSLKEIIWRSYNNDESYFEDKNLENTFKKNLIETQEKKKQFAHNQKTYQESYSYFFSLIIFLKILFAIFAGMFPPLPPFSKKITTEILVFMYVI